MDKLPLDYSPPPQLPKARHGCVTAYLIFSIIVNSATALFYLLSGDFVSDALPGASSTMVILLALVGLANVAFAVLLFQWKRLGFWGFIGTSIVALGINISIGLGIGQSLAGLIGIGVLYAILQIPENNVSAWDNLE